MLRHHYTRIIIMMCFLCAVKHIERSYTAICRTSRALATIKCVNSFGVDIARDDIAPRWRLVRHAYQVGHNNLMRTRAFFGRARVFSMAILRCARGKKKRAWLSVAARRCYNIVGVCVMMAARMGERGAAFKSSIYIYICFHTWIRCERVFVDRIKCLMRYRGDTLTIQ